jgi:hypothetical protein
MVTSSQFNQWPLMGQRSTAVRARLGFSIVTAFFVAMAALVGLAAPAAAAAPEPAGLAPRPTAVTATTISVRILRSPAPDLVCKPDIGYEVLGGVFADWRDVGGFPNAPCDDPDPGYKFSGLTAGTTYTFQVRAYRITGGVKEYSAPASMTASTSAASTSPTPAGDVNPPTMAATPTAVTTSSISVRFLRSPAPDRVCKADIGYEMLGGAFADWHDVGGFPNAPCDDPDPGYKFSGLTVDTSYTLSVRAYRVTGGVKSYSTPSSITVSTKGINPPTLSSTPSATSTTSISIRFLRSPAPDLVCKPDVGYEVLGGTFADWQDLGGFPDAPCDQPGISYKFTGLASGTTYTLTIRAYRLRNGVKEYSSAPSMTAVTAGESTGPAEPGVVSQPGLKPAPTSVTSSSISIRFLRSPAPDMVCKPDIGYEVLGGEFGDWFDVGGFPNAPCDDPDVGYKFGGLAAATTYTLSIRAYRITDGVKQHSAAATLTATTLAAP